MLNNGAKWYNFSPPRWSFIAPPLTAGIDIDRPVEVRQRRRKILFYEVDTSPLVACIGFTRIDSYSYVEILYGPIVLTLFTVGDPAID